MDQGSALDVRQVHGSEEVAGGGRLSQPLTDEPDGDDGGSEIDTMRASGTLPVIIWDAELSKRRVVPMHWGLADWRVGALFPSLDDHVPHRLSTSR